MGKQLTFHDENEVQDYFGAICLVPVC